MGSRCLNKGLWSPRTPLSVIRSQSGHSALQRLLGVRAASQCSMSVTPASHRHKCVLWVFFTFFITFYIYEFGKCFIRWNLYCIHIIQYIWSVLAFSGNRTHDLGVVCTMLYLCEQLYAFAYFHCKYSNLIDEHILAHYILIVLNFK